jgi:hypothetical protein
MLLIIENATFFSRNHTVRNIVIIQKPWIETEVSRHAVLSYLVILMYFPLTANGFLPGGSGTTITHNSQTKHITQNYTKK